MNPRRIKLHNYRSTIDLDLELPDGTVAITGTNGAGKSSIIGAIEVALFGVSGKATLASYHAERATDDTVSVELEFDHGGIDYTVKRSYSVAGRGKPTLDVARFGSDESWDGWAPITRGTVAETQAMLEELIGLERDTFRASTFLAQGDGAAFTEAEPRNRKRILADVLSLDVWERAGALVRDDRNNAEQDARTIAARVDVLSERAEGADEVAAAIVEREDKLESIVDAIGRASSTLEAEQRRMVELETAQTRFDAFARAAETARRAANDHDRLRANAEAECQPSIAGARAELAGLSTGEQLDDFELERKGLLERQSRLESERAAFNERAREAASLVLQRDGLREREQGTLADADRVWAQIQAIDLEPAPTCDRCRQTMDADARDHARKSLEQQETQAREAAAELRRQIDAIVLPELGVEPDPELAGVLVAELADVVGRIVAARAGLERRATLEQIVTAATARLEGVRTPEFDAENRRLNTEALEAEGRLTQDLVVDPGALGNARESAAMLTRKLELDRQTESTLRSELGGLRERLDGKRQAAAELETARREAGDVLSRLIELQELERAFGRDGIPTWIVEQHAIPQIEADASRLLEDLGGPVTRVELRTERALKSGGTSDELDIVCVTEAGDRDYSTFSGGERTRVNLALRIALARLLASRAGTGSRVLLMDEPDYLDSDGMAALVSLLRSELVTGAFDRVMVVSHVPELRSAFDQSIQVEKIDGESVVTFA